MYVKTEMDINDLDSRLWGGAADKWANATDEQRLLIWETLIDFFGARDAIPDMTTINDFIWFEYDKIYYPEEID